MIRAALWEYPPVSSRGAPPGPTRCGPWVAWNCMDDVLGNSCSGSLTSLCNLCQLALGNQRLLRVCRENQTCKVKSRRNPKHRSKYRYDRSSMHPSLYPRSPSGSITTCPPYKKPSMNPCRTVEILLHTQQASMKSLLEPLLQILDRFCYQPSSKASMNPSTNPPRPCAAPFRVTEHAITHAAPFQGAR